MILSGLMSPCTKLIECKNANWSSSYSHMSRHSNFVREEGSMSKRDFFSFSITMNSRFGSVPYFSHIADGKMPKSTSVDNPFFWSCFLILDMAFNSLLDILEEVILTTSGGANSS